MRALFVVTLPLLFGCMGWFSPEPSPVEPQKPNYVEPAVPLAPTAATPEQVAIVEGCFRDLTVGRPCFRSLTLAPTLQASMENGAQLDADPVLNAQDFENVRLIQVSRKDDKVVVDFENFGKRSTALWSFDAEDRLLDIQHGDVHLADMLSAP